MRIETNERGDTMKLKGCEEDEMNREMGPQLEVEKMIDIYRWLALPVRTLIERLLSLTADSCICLQLGAAFLATHQMFNVIVPPFDPRWCVD